MGFEPLGTELGVVRSKVFAVGGLDGDHLSDLVLASAAGRVQVLRLENEGLRLVVDQLLPTPAGADGPPEALSLRLEDVDGDERQDLVLFSVPQRADSWDRRRG